MSMEKVKKAVQIEEPPEPAPSITPELVRSTLEILESKGLIHLTEKGAYVPTVRGWRLLTEIKTTKEEIEAFGHKDIKCGDLKRIVLTKKGFPEDDSVIGVKANKSAKELSEEFKSALKQGRKVEIEIEVNGKKEIFSGFGSPALSFEDEEKIEIRKDDEIREGTIVILSNKSASELNEEIRDLIRNPETKIKMTLIVRSE